MRVAAAVLALLSLGCAGAGSDDSPAAFDVEVVNQYAESLFTVSVATGGETFAVFTDERIDGYDSAVAEDAVEAEQGAALDITIVSTSLGDDYNTEFSDEVAGEALVLCYSYDLATTEFVFAHGWDAYCD